MKGNLKKLKNFVNENFMHFSWGFYIVLAADVLLVPKQNDLTYVFVLLYFGLVFAYSREVEVRFIYILSLVLLLLSAAFSVLGGIPQADKLADYTFLFLMVGLIVDVRELIIGKS